MYTFRQDNIPHKNSIMRIFSLLFPLLFLLPSVATAQSAKTKSKDRFREKNDLHYPVRLVNTTEINQEGSDFAPAFYQNGIVFVSSRTKNGVQDARTKETYNRLYFSSFDPNGDPTSPGSFSLDINRKSDEIHDRALSFSRDGKTVYYTRTSNKNGVKQGNNMKIYWATYGVPDWNLKGELHFNSDKYNCMHPSLSVDGSKLFFSSDMPGGQGGFDLYYVEKGPDGWSAPVNLGDLINTPKDEMFPFISQSNTLFFSSNGRDNSLGGMDIYYVNKPTENPEEVVNMASPFNSADDDVSFIMNEEGRNGFFASKRKGGLAKGDFATFDIYRFMADRGIEGVTKPAKNALNITVTSAKTGMPIQGASIRVLLPTDDGFVGQTNNEFYRISLDQDPSNPKMLKFSLVRKDAEDLGQADHYSNVAGKVETELIRFKPALILVSYPGYRTKERFIAVDKETDYNLTFALPDAPICLRANGLVLSENYGTRIGNARLKFINKENDQKTEIRTDINGQFSACLPAEGKYLLQVERDGFKGENFSLDVQTTTELFQEIRMRPLTKVASAEETLPLATTLQAGSIIRMEQVFYEKNRSTLNQNATRSVEGLIDLLQRFPEMEVDLYTHTDTRGEAAQNMRLTKEQADNIMAYLEHREKELKISDSEKFSKRVKPFGKGDTEPMNHCKKSTDCSEAEHQQNNRIEIKITKVGTIQRP